MSLPKANSKWLRLAIASGCCAAFNGVFAKLTTTELTASWSSSIASLFSLNPSNKLIEVAIRGFFFALNLVFNGVMWGLFTQAMVHASSTVRVSIINTSANFMVTAVLGALIFSEKLPEKRGEKKAGEQQSVNREGDANNEGYKDDEDDETVELMNVGDESGQDSKDEESSDEDAVLK